jgi:hypothetical protein
VPEAVGRWSLVVDDSTGLELRQGGRAMATSQIRPWIPALRGNAGWISELAATRNAAEITRRARELNGGSCPAAVCPSVSELSTAGQVSRFAGFLVCLAVD